MKMRGRIPPAKPKPPPLACASRGTTETCSRLATLRANNAVTYLLNGMYRQWLHLARVQPETLRLFAQLHRATLGFSSLGPAGKFLLLNDLARRQGAPSLRCKD